MVDGRQLSPASIKAAGGLSFVEICLPIAKYSLRMLIDTGSIISLIQKDHLTKGVCSRLVCVDVSNISGSKVVLGGLSTDVRKKQASLGK
jgi:hypothetical protein